MKKYLVTIKFEEHYLVNAEDEQDAELQMVEEELEPWKEGTPIMEIYELNQEGLLH
jgi:hypothetical protein